jgi:hypothetical protein
VHWWSGFPTGWLSIPWRVIRPVKASVGQSTDQQPGGVGGGRPGRSAPPAFSLLTSSACRVVAAGALVPDLGRAGSAAAPERMAVMTSPQCVRVGCGAGLQPGRSAGRVGLGAGLGGPLVVRPVSGKAEVNQGSGGDKMTRIMRDSTTPTDITHHGTDLVAGYSNGNFKWSKAGFARFPGIPHVHIDVNGTNPAGRGFSTANQVWRCARSGYLGYRSESSTSGGISARHLL